MKIKATSRRKQDRHDAPATQKGEKYILQKSCTDDREADNVDFVTSLRTSSGMCTTFFFSLLVLFTSILT